LHRGRGATCRAFAAATATPSPGREPLGPGPARHNPGRRVRGPAGARVALQRTSRESRTSCSGFGTFARLALLGTTGDARRRTSRAPSVENPRGVVATLLWPRDCRRGLGVARARRRPQSWSRLNAICPPSWYRWWHTATNKAAGRRRAALELPLLGSNQDSPDPESGVLPVTPRGRDRNSSREGRPRQRV